jgi:RTX calcium-binding nonapeptide repeat (4 copies)
MSDDQNTGGTTLGPETSSLRSIQFTIDGEPGTLITVAETETGALAFSIKVTDTITSSFDKPDIADLRGLFFHVSNESLLSGLLITGSHVTSSSVSANKVIDLKNGVNMNGLGHFDIGVEFGTPGMSTDDIQETTFTLTHTSQPLTIEFVTEQGFGARLTSVSDDGIGRELSLKLVGQSPEAPLLPPPAEDEDGDDDEDVPPPPAENEDGDDDEDVPPPPAENESGDDDDLIEAGADDDTIFGGPGNDEMQGEGGDDLIIGGRDNGHLGDGTLLSVIIGDNLYGNDGRDTFVFSKGDGVDLIWDFQPGMDRVLVSGYTLADVDQVAFVGDVTNRIATGGHQKLALILKEASDAIIFNDFPNPSAQDVAIQFADGSALSSAELLARASASSSAAGFSSTIINGSTTIPASTASLEQAGSNSGDTLTGGAGNDKLYGNGGGDLLTGREGADKLYGADGTDLIYGDSVEQLPADLLAYFTGSPSVVPAPAHAGSAVPVEALPSSALIPPPTTEKISTTIDVVNS